MKFPSAFRRFLLSKNEGCHENFPKNSLYFDLESVNVKIVLITPPQLSVQEALANANTLQ